MANLKSIDGHDHTPEFGRDVLKVDNLTTYFQNFSPKPKSLQMPVVFHSLG
jgi:hypothetical protein